MRKTTDGASSLESTDDVLNTALACVYGLLVFAVAAVLVSSAILLVAPSASVVVIGVMSALLAHLAAVYFTLSFLKQKPYWREWLEIRKPTVKSCVDGTFYGLVLFFGLQATAYAVNSLTNASLGSSDTSTALSDSSSTATLLTLVVFAPFIVPLVEEITYRGFLRNLLTKFSKGKTGQFIGIAGSSTVFAAAHFQGLGSLTDAIVLVWTFALGVVTCALTIKYASIWPAVSTHIVYNLMTVVAILA